MKNKIIGILLITSLVVTFLGCSKSPSKTSGDISPTTSPTLTTTPSAAPNTVTAEKIEDYFPLKADVHMKYKGSSTEYSELSTFVDYLTKDKIQIKNITSGTIAAIVYQISGGELKKVYSQEENYYKHDFTGSTNNKNEVLLKEPLKVGTSWKLENGDTSSITSTNSSISTPAGNYTAIEVTTKGKDYTNKNYYAKGFGLVKSIYKGSSGMEITRELEKYEENKPFVSNIRIYFADVLNDKIVYQDRPVEIQTNQDMKFKFQKELKTPPEGIKSTPILSKNTQINSASVDEKKGIVLVDLSSDFKKEMNLGSGPEIMVLQCITNTFGHYYGKDKVIITVDGKPYTSGHIMMDPGQYFKVDYSNNLEIKK